MSNDPFTIPEPDDDLMSCHANGEDPEGYDADDPQDTCANCADKFTCLPAAVANPSVWTSRGAKTWTIEDDVEVAGVLARSMTYSTAIERMGKRNALARAGKLIPAELLVRPREEDIEPDPPEPEEPEEELEPEQPPEPEEPEEEPEVESPEAAEETDVSKSKKKAAKKAVKKAAAKKTAVKKKASAKPAKAAKKKAPAKAAKKTAVKKAPAKPEKAAKKTAVKKAPAKPSKAPPKAPAAEAPKKKTPARPKSEKPPKPTPPPKPRKPTTSEPRISERNGKTLPGPKSITEEEMIKAMGKIKLGMRIDFDFGMQIVRRARTGKEHVVTLQKQGFLYEGELYSSLSAASQNASGTPCRSGNDWFNLTNTSCTEVRDVNGVVIARKGMDL